jgi:chaperonin GroEL (HSP60 family)
MRKKLSEKYQNEREEICKKLIEMLELDDNNCFILHELDNNIEKQNKILELKTEIQKVFECSTISSFKPNFECKRPYLNIVRSILRKQKYNFIGNDYVIKINGVPKKTIKYIIFRI